MWQAAQELEELKALAVVPGAKEMHQKYRSLLHPYLQSYGLVSDQAPPAWDQDAAMRQMFNRFQQTMDKGRVIDFLQQLREVVDQLQGGMRVSQRVIDAIVSQSSEMGEAIQQMADEHPQLPGLFERNLQLLHTELGKLGERQLSTGYDHLIQGDFEKAIDFCQRAYEYYLAAQDFVGQGMALQGQAFAYQNLEQPDEAEEAYQQAQTRYQEGDAHNRECRLVYAWGNFCLEQSRFDQAKELYSRGIQLAEAEGDETLQVEGHTRMGNAWSDQGRFELAITSYQTAIDIAQSVGERTEQRQTWISLGRLYQSLQNPVDAIRCYEEALLLVDDQTSTNDEAAILVSMNMTYQALGQYKEAQERWKKALALAQEMGDPNFLNLVRLSQPKE
jgi:tetratricopeptide (TPR) repeat protein